MRYCVMAEGQEGVAWERWLALAEACERLGFEALFTSDHYLSEKGLPERGSSDAWTVLAALAARTSRLRLGTLVSPVTFRHPTLLAKIASTVDHISGGRVDLGLGAGWWVEEHRTHGFPFPPTEERFDLLEQQLEVVHGLFTQETFSFEGRHYSLENCSFVPKPVQDPHPPIIVGGEGGPRMARLVARWADEFNTVGGSPEEVGQRIARVREAVEAAGRDPGEVTTSYMTWCFVGADEREFRAKVERARHYDPGAGDFDDYLADLEDDCILGTPERAAGRIAEYEAAGVQRFILNHELWDDLEMLELLAAEVLPRVR